MCVSLVCVKGLHKAVPAHKIPDINSAHRAGGTLIVQPQHRPPGNPFSAPVYGSSGSAPPPAACASCSFLFLLTNETFI